MNSPVVQSAPFLFRRKGVSYPQRKSIEHEGMERYTGQVCEALASKLKL